MDNLSYTACGGNGEKCFAEPLKASIEDRVIPLNESYQEILKLHQMLADESIPHVTERFLDGWRVCYPVRREEGKACVCDAIEHYGSFGREQDKLEIMGLLTPEEKKHDSVLGYLTAEDVFARIKTHWEKTEN